MKKRIKNKQLSDASVPKNNILVGLKKKLKERERERKMNYVVFTQTFSVTREITREKERFVMYVNLVEEFTKNNRI